MKILLDHQTFELQRFGGISRYFAELLRNRAGFEVDLALKRSSNTYLDPDDPRCRGVGPGEDAFERLLAGVEFRGKGRVHKALRKVRVVEDPSRVNRLHSLELIRRGAFDVFHPTYYDPYFLGSLGSRPFVVTVFDMIHEVFPEYFHVGDHTSIHKRRLCERAARIIAISSTTKSDLIRFFGIREDRIDVIHLASSFGSDTPRVEAAVPTPARYLLFTGHRMFYKNFAFFIQAVAPLLRQHQDLGVVCTGPRFTSFEVHTFEQLGIGQQMVHCPADDRQLGKLYRNAELFVFPSLYEGFGIPLIEAFSSRCPVAASDIEVFREIGGDAVAFFRPKDPESIRETVRTVLHDQRLRGELIERGLEKSHEFSWQITAEQTRRTYDKV